MTSQKGKRKIKDQRVRKDRKETTIPLDRARWQLAKLWFVLVTPTIGILIIQSIFGKYEGRAHNIWGWALPTVMPTLSLIIAALGATALEADKSKAEVKRPFYATACWLSAVYLLLILATILVEPLTHYESLELLGLSNLWLGPFQGLVASSIGVLFLTKQPKGD